MKLCVIGGTGARSAFLTKSLVKNARSIRVDHIVLLDNDERKLRTYGSIAREIAARLEPDLEFTVTSDATAALTDVDYIITTIRAGGDEGRLFDERTCMELGVLGQETTGGGGFAMAIRSIPTLLYYCNLAKKVAKPGHLIFNFTNPSGIITQAMRQQGFDNVYGICDAPSGFIKQLEEILEVPYGSLDITCYGLNHLSWLRNASLGGKDILVLPQPQGHPGQILRQPGILLQKKGHHMMPDPVTQKRVAFIGAVLHIGQAPTFQERLGLPAGHRQKGADDLSVYRGDAPQALQSRAPKQVHQQGFCIVVGGVGGGDLPGEASQKGVSGLPGGGLQSFLSGLDEGAPHRQGDLIPGAEFPDESLVLVGFRPPEVVIEMGGRQAQL